MTDFDYQEPSTRPKSVIQAVPLQEEEPAEDVLDENVLDDEDDLSDDDTPSRAVPSRG